MILIYWLLTLPGTYDHASRSVLLLEKTGSPSSAVALSLPPLGLILLPAEMKFVTEQTALFLGFRVLKILGQILSGSQRPWTNMALVRLCICYRSLLTSTDGIGVVNHLASSHHPQTNRLFICLGPSSTFVLKYDAKMMGKAGSLGSDFCSHTLALQNQTIYCIAAVPWFYIPMYFSSCENENDWKPK